MRTVAYCCGVNCHISNHILDSSVSCTLAYQCSTMFANSMKATVYNKILDGTCA